MRLEGVTKTLVQCDFDGTITEEEASVMLLDIFAEIGEVMVTEGKATVYFRKISSKPGQAITEALTQPFHIIKTERIDALPIAFLRRD